MKKASTDPAAPRTCANCGIPERLATDGLNAKTISIKDCSRCKLVGYCGKDCQTQHWKTGGHKEFCLTPEERRPEPKVQSEIYGIDAHVTSSSTSDTQPSIFSTPWSQSATDAKKEAVASPSIPVCTNCGIREGVDGTHIKSCNRCQAVKYCGRDCQMQHWKSGGHKKFCMTPGERRPEVVAAEEGQPRPRSGTRQSPMDKENQCSICLDTLDSASGPTTLLSCTHMFHVSCVEGLRKFGVSKVCPVCRGELEGGPEKNFEEATRRYFFVEAQVKKGQGVWQ